ncbi:hypothetical protein J9317_18245 [Metabacillus sp. KIGAM252]|uniref:Uncharacterized protein n=1 Tax=Metabacillus flavus TaxID=2823519 RepID=A0ABS5LIZ1_9BACI|nr:hypothetical protein [Metabacillus flavus]MBS2970687.1 hypothetical protein [Metabacillus flavus]
MSREFLQHYYTSAVSGLGSGPGFQTFSKSKEMTDAEKTEIEAYCTYKRPSHLPPNPTAEEISTLFPKSFSFIRLNSGKIGLSLTQYTGRDYSGRFGNSFSHTLITDGALNDYPFTYAFSPVFVSGLTKEESESETAPAPLPVLAGLKGGRLSIDSVLDFLHENNGWDVLVRMVSGAIEGIQNGKRLIIVDYEDRIPMWFAAIQLSFPLRLAHHLTFTTYTYDPLKSKALLNGAVSEGTALTISEGMMRHQAFVFDFEQERFSQFEKNHDYAEFAVSLLNEGWSKTKPFYDFLEGMNIDSIEGSLSRAKDLYMFFEQSAENVSGGQLAAALEYAEKHAPEQALINMAYSLKNGLEDNKDDQKAFLADLDLELVRRVTSLLFTASEKEGSGGALTQFSTAFFLDAAEHLLKGIRSSAEAEQILELCLKTSQRYPQIKEKLPKKLSEILKWGKEGYYSDIIGYFLEETISLHELKGIHWLNSEESYRKLLLTSALWLIEKQADRVVNGLLNDYYRTMGNALLYIHSKNRLQEKIEGYFKENLNSNLAKIMDLDETAAAETLFVNLQKEKLSGSDLPISDFLNAQAATGHRMNLDSLLPAVFEAFNQLENTQTIKAEMQVLLQRGSQLTINPSEKSRLIEKTEGIFSFTSETNRDKSLVRNLYDWKNAKLTKPDKSYLLTAGCIIHDRETPYGFNLSELPLHLIKLGDKQYFQFAAWVLPVRMKTEENPDDVIKLLAGTKRSPLFWQVLQNLEEKNSPAYSSLLTAFIRNISHSEELDEELEDRIVQFMTQNKKLYKHVSEKMEEKSGRKSRSKENYWPRIQEQVESGQTLFGKMKGLFSRR